MNRVIAAVVFALALACGPQELVLSEAGEATGSSAAALTTTETTITFTDSWNISQSNLLVKGQTVRVSYDTDRLPQCRGDYMGKPAWSITGYYQLNGGPIGSFEAGGYSPSNGTVPPTFELTETGDLAIWFHVTNRWGCSAYDSNFGKNFHFTVNAHPAVHFKADWTQQVEGLPGTMPTLIVNYDLSRLPNCRQTYNGAPTWEVLVYYRFDGGAVSYKPVTYADGYDRVSVPTHLEIPSGAKQVEMWFKNTDRAGCVAWDSAYGANYKFMVN